MRPSGVYLSTASGKVLDSLARISSRDIPVCWDRVCRTSAPIVCSNCGGAICLFGPRATQESATSPWPFCLKASISSRSPPLNVSPMLAPPSIPPSSRVSPRGHLSSWGQQDQQDCSALHGASLQSCPCFGTPRWRGVLAERSLRDIRGSYHHPCCSTLQSYCCEPSRSHVFLGQQDNPEQCISFQPPLRHCRGRQSRGLAE